MQQEGQKGQSMHDIRTDHRQYNNKVRDASHNITTLLWIITSAYSRNQHFYRTVKNDVDGSA